jgi:hypothetical protein
MVQTLKRWEKCLGELRELREQCRNAACYVWKLRELELERSESDLLDSRL